MLKQNNQVGHKFSFAKFFIFFSHFTRLSFFYIFSKTCPPGLPPPPQDPLKYDLFILPPQVCITYHLSSYTLRLHLALHHSDLFPLYSYAIESSGPTRRRNVLKFHIQTLSKVLCQMDL